MKVKFIILMLLFPLLGFAQVPRYNFFGIDLNLDWQSLTNYHQLQYDSIVRRTPDEVPYIVTDFKFSVANVDQRFLDLGFESMGLGFPKDGLIYFKNLKPQLFLAIISYGSFEYKVKSQIDVLKVKTLIEERYGEANLNMVREEFSTYKWDGAFYTIALMTRKEDLKTTLVYFKK